MKVDLAAFKRNYLVAGLSDEDVRRVADLAELKVVPGGHEIVRLGARDPHLYVVLEGTVVVCRQGGVVLGERGPGSVIGEVALVDDQPRSAYAVAKSNLTYARFDGVALRRFMVRNPQIGFLMLSNLSRVLSARLREASATIEDLRGQLADPWLYAD